MAQDVVPRPRAPSRKWEILERLLALLGIRSMERLLRPLSRIGELAIPARRQSPLAEPGEVERQPVPRLIIANQVIQPDASGMILLMGRLSSWAVESATTTPW